MAGTNQTNDIPHRATRERLARSFFWIVWSRGAVQLVSFAATLLVARLLAPGDYGLMALAGIWIHGLSLLAEMGLGAVIVQFRDLQDVELDTCFWLTMAAAFAGCVLVWVFAAPIARWFDAPRLETVARALSVSLLLLAVRTVPDGLLRRELALDRIAKAEAAASLAAIPVVLGLALVGAGVWALVAGLLFSQLVQSVVVFSFAPWRPRLRFTTARIRRVVDYSLSTLGGRLCWVAYQEADSFVLGKVAGGHALGLYAIARQLALLPVEKVSTIVGQVASPLMAGLQTDRDAMGRSFLRGIGLLGWVTLPASVGLALVAEDFVRVALTERWVPMAPILQVLCLYAVVRSLAVLPPHVLLARYRARLLFGYNLSLLVLMPGAFWIGAAGWGALGVATAWAVVYPLFAIEMTRRALVEMGISWRALVARIGPPAAATLFMAAAVAGVRLVLPFDGADDSFARLSAMTLTGVLAYGLALLGIGGSARSDVLEVAGWLLRSQRLVPAEK